MPIVDIPNKICPHCGGTTWYKYNNRNSTTCLTKMKERHARYYLSYQEKIKQNTKINWNNRKTDALVKQNNQRVANWKKRNPNKAKLYKQKSDVKVRLHLKDEYIKKLLTQYTDLTFTEIPQDLVKLKRKELVLKRQLKLGEAGNYASMGTLLPVDLGTRILINHELT